MVRCSTSRCWWRRCARMERSNCHSPKCSSGSTTRSAALRRSWTTRSPARRGVAPRPKPAMPRFWPGGNAGARNSAASEFAYGANLVEQLVRDMTRRFGRGFSRQNLWQMRQFGSAYPPERILQTLSGESARPRPRHSPICALKTSSRSFRPLASLRAAAVGQESTRPRILRSRGAPRRMVRPPTRSTDQPPRRPREAPARRHAAGRTEVGSVSRCAEILEET